jgi:hypothetical protein
MPGRLKSGREIVVAIGQVEMSMARPRIGSFLGGFALFASTPTEINLITLHELLTLTRAPAP